VLTTASSGLAKITPVEDRPSDDDTWTVTGTEDGAAQWAIRAYVICVAAL
jgi:hypothetical protein